jgi:hypothetical protein
MNETKPKDEQNKENPYNPFPDYRYFHDLRRAWEMEPILLIEESRTMMLTWLFAGFCLHYQLRAKSMTLL